MSSDRNCFLDHHTQAVQFTAFVAKHSLNMLMQAFMRKQASEGLAFFARGQTVGPQASTEDLLRDALKVLGADYAVFWGIPERPQTIPFEACVWVPASSAVEPRAFWLDDDPSLVRREGMTHGIYHYCETQKSADALFCVHVLSGLRCIDDSFPDYSFEVYRRGPGGDYPENDILTKAGSFRDTEGSDFPGIELPVSLNTTTDKHPHTQVGLVVAQHGSPPVIRGVMWIGYDGLRDLNWWERAYLRGLSNYLAQGIAASGLVLALRSFRHSIENLATRAYPDESELASAEGDIQVSGIAEETQVNLERARAGLQMVHAKALELKRMLLWSQGEEASPLKAYAIRDALKNAWAVATSLAMLPSMFECRKDNEFIYDQCRDMTIVYSKSVDPEKSHVSGAVYAAATVVLENALIHGESPFFAWVISLSPEIRILFGNAGNPPHQEDDTLRVPEAKMVFGDQEHGVGLWFARRLLNTEGGVISLSKKPSGTNIVVPQVVNQCRTFYEIFFPREVE
ncbi:hypothetical protein ACFL6U_32440 [Planctomycetota bacterium]